MPIVFVCGKCKKEQEKGPFSKPQGWTITPVVGGVRVRCPECSQKEGSK